MKRPLRVAGIGLVATLLLTPGLAASADSIAPLVVAPAPFYLESDAAHGFMYEYARTGSCCPEKALSILDPSGSVVATFDSWKSADGIAVGGDTLYVGSDNETVIHTVDLSVNPPVEGDPIEVGYNNDRHSVIFAGGFLWYLSCSGGALRVNPSTGATVGVDISGISFSCLAVNDPTETPRRSLWVVDPRSPG